LYTIGKPIKEGAILPQRVQPLLSMGYIEAVKEAKTDAVTPEITASTPEPIPNIPEQPTPAQTASRSPQQSAKGRKKVQ